MRIWQQGVGAVIVASFVAFSIHLGLADEGNVAQPLAAPAGSAGEAANAEGIKHYGAGHWEVAEKHFREAITADDNLAVAHYNLALALDNQDRHKEATQEFDRALKLAPDNPSIAESGILKGHLKRMHRDQSPH
ncbi:MAG: tetratricopeptide repeat protein [Nitrospirota bacterium]